VISESAFAVSQSIVLVISYGQPSSEFFSKTNGNHYKHHIISQNYRYSFHDTGLGEAIYVYLNWQWALNRILATPETFL